MNCPYYYYGLCRGDRLVAPTMVFDVILSAARREESRCLDNMVFHNKKRDPSLHFVPLRMTLAYVSF